MCVCVCVPAVYDSVIKSVFACDGEVRGGGGDAWGCCVCYGSESADTYIL